MSHLSTERLAAVADDDLTADEATHIAGCWDCRAEVAAYRRLARLGAMAPVPMEPLTAWSSLAPQLRAEGIIVDRSIAPRRSLVPHWAVRAAAGLALLAGGLTAGRLSAGISLGGAPATELPAATTVATFRTSEEALQALTVAQQQYQSAAAFLAAQDTSSRFVGMNQDAYQTRLAALDEIAAAARTALYRTPQDPMLNQYYITTLGAREATLRQIGASLPETRRLERY